ncbi:MAG: manganese efflux pump MntP family protein [Acidobacteriota bacterium]
MDLLTIIVIAIGLSMDSFAVSLTNGFVIKDLNLKNALKIAFSFSLFQTLMPLIGWVAGSGFEQYIREIDHWIAFFLLSFLGLRMIYSGLIKRGVSLSNKISFFTLISQSIATSIDALAVGISFALLNISILSPVLIIGIVTFLFSMTGLYLGRKFGKKFGNIAEIIGGMILIGIGLKILIEHLYY